MGKGALIGAAIAIVVGLLLFFVLKPGSKSDDAVPAQNAAEAGNASAPLTGIRAQSEKQQLDAAFQAVYGKAGSAKIKSKDGDTLTAKPGKLLWIGDIAVLLSPAESASDCHACAGTLALAYLKASGDGFEVTGKWPDLIYGAGWGAAPDWKMTDAFTQSPAIYVEGGYMGQGYSCSSATITELKPDGPAQSEPIGLSSSNAGAIDEETGKTFGGDPAIDLKGKIVDIVKGKSFSVKASGTASFVEKYIYRDGKFVSMQETRLTC